MLSFRMENKKSYWKPNTSVLLSTTGYASFAKTNWLCKCKQAREEELHLVLGQCQVYGDLTHKFSNLTDDNSLVQFFQEVLARREEMDKLQRNPVGGDNTDVVANSVSSDGISQSRG